MPKKASKSKKSKKSENEGGECVHCGGYDTTEEHRVFSHLMYILFLIAAAIAAYYTYNTFQYNVSEDFLPVKGLLFLGWAYLFKVFAHRVHFPHH